MDLQLRDRVAVVTGGSSGIGLAVVRQFLAEGARVISCGRDNARLRQSVTILEGEGVDTGGLVTQACDVLDDSALAALVADFCSPIDDPKVGLRPPVPQGDQEPWGGPTVS